MSRNRHTALLALVLFVLYLGAPILHVLDHAHGPDCGRHVSDGDHPLCLATTATARHAPDCPLCRMMFHAAPLLVASDPAIEARLIGTDCGRSNPDRSLPTVPSVCWTSPRGPPAA